LIADTSPYSGCAVHWHRGTAMEAMVYNRDFVEANFNTSADLEGIFTLGQENIETQNRIGQVKRDVEGLTQRIEQLTLTLGGADGRGGKRGELDAVESAFRDECWKVFTVHDAKLQGALTGYRGNKQKFKERLLAECAKDIPAPPQQAELEAKALSVFGAEPVAQRVLTEVDSVAFLAWETDPILKKKVIGKTDVDIAAMIQKLSSSDWVKQGIEFYELNDGVCPFCQQKAPHTLAASLEEYFDDAFTQDTAAIAALRSGYKLEGDRIRLAMQADIDSGTNFLDVEKLKAEKALFETRFQLNQQRIETKVKEPSQAVVLDQVDSVLAAARQLIADANDKIRAHNVVVANLASERRKLTDQVWAFFAQIEITRPLAKYKADKADVEKAIARIEEQINTAKPEKAAKENEIKTLEKSTTSVQPTVSEINKILRGFGFRNFTIEAKGSNFYRICRPDGSDAKNTLSEGERSFITFLYFYHLLRGSKTETGMTGNRVVVFDDPVSSLDSDVLFIVGTLIREVIEEARSKAGQIKQVFVLTHNVYFHKEITFNAARCAGVALKGETFWVIRKINGISKVQKHATNPVTTSYDLLWSEVRERNLASQTIQNTLRRILESYFRVLGGMSQEDILSHFAGEEKLICKSLLSWINDGSHAIPDDLFVSLDEGMVEKYLAVFKNVFVNLRQLNHYNMMMGGPPAIETDAAL